MWEDRASDATELAMDGIKREIGRLFDEVNEAFLGLGDG